MLSIPILGLLDIWCLPTYNHLGKLINDVKTDASHTITYYVETENYFQMQLSVLK